MAATAAKYHNAAFANTKAYTLSGKLDYIKMEENPRIMKMMTELIHAVPESLKDPEKDKM